VGGRVGKDAKREKKKPFPTCLKGGEDRGPMESTPRRGKKESEKKRENEKISKIARS